MKRLRVMAFALLGLLLLGVGNHAAAQPEPVVLYNGVNYQGANKALTESWSGGGGFDRNIQSIRVPPGYRLTLYAEKNYRGTQTTITGDWNPGAGAWWINRIRSIRVDRAQIQPPIRPPVRPPVRPPAPRDFPVIYAGTNFDGPAEAIERDWSSNDWDGSPHTIRSIRVPQGWYLVLYARRNFTGRSYNVSSNITFAPGDFWYNRIRSIRVYKGQPPIQPR